MCIYIYIYVYTRIHTYQRIVYVIRPPSGRRLRRVGVRGASDHRRRAGPAAPRDVDGDYYQ